MSNKGTNDNRAIITVMGAVGVGKSTFIKHLTGDESIVIGRSPESETVDVETYFYTDSNSGVPVTLLDTPGFDNSGDRISDINILKKIAAFLQDGGWEVKGVIFVHCISHPRMSSMSSEFVRMFQEMCGSDRLSNVRIVTTKWDLVGDQEGNNFEAALTNHAFKPLIDIGAKMARQDNERDSALLVMSELIHELTVEAREMEEERQREEEQRRQIEEELEEQRRWLEEGDEEEEREAVEEKDTRSSSAIITENKKTLEKLVKR